MAATKTPGSAGRADALAAFAEEGCVGPRLWSNAAGDRLDLEPGTEHAATIGRHGCHCAEASR